MQKKAQLLLLILVSFFPLKETVSQCFTSTNAFNPGEKISYHAYYNWGFIWLNAGYVNFSVADKSFDDKDALYFRAYGRTFEKYDRLFKVRDLFHAYINKNTYQPLWFERETSEGGYKVHNIYNYNTSESLVYTQSDNSNKSLEMDTLSIKECTYDVLTTIYSARNINFAQYDPGEKIPINMIVANKVYDLYIRYRGKETIEIKTGRKFRCIKFTPLLVEGTIFQGGENMTVWVTDDKNRIPVLIEAKILVGSVKAILKETKELKYPMSAEIE